MTVKPKLREAQIPDTVTFAAAVRFPSEPQPFDVDFELDLGGDPEL